MIDMSELKPPKDRISGTCLVLLFCILVPIVTIVVGMIAGMGR